MSQPATLQAEIKSWWEAHPMTYDWLSDSPYQPGTVDFFLEIDRRFWKAAWFGHRGNEAPFSRLIDYPAMSGKHVLEIGCGAGSITQQLAEHGARVTAIDLTTQAVNLTQRRFELFALPGVIRRLNAEEMDFPDGSFDFVWSWGVIHHSANTEKIVSEIHRVLKPGGEARLMVYNRNSIDFQVGIKLIRGILLGGLLRSSLDDLANECSDGRIARYYKPSELKALVSKYFSAVDTEIYGQKVEVWQIPGGRHKDFLVSATPDKFAWWLTRRFGTFLTVRARKLDTTRL